VKIPVADPHVASLPLVFHDSSARVDRDPQMLASRLAQHYSMLDFGPRRGWERTFLHRSSSAAAGNLILSCGYLTPIQGAIGERPGSGSINICFAGRCVYHVDGGSQVITPATPLFFAPGHAYNYSVDHFNGVAFDVDLQRLRRTAATMAGFGVSERRFQPDLQMVRCLSIQNERNTKLLKTLRKTIALVDEASLEASSYLSLLQIDDVIYRILALMLFPKLSQLLDERGVEGPSSRSRIFDELLEWIDANLQRPIHLTELEQISGYSRRHLQAAFQQRFGCGPIQWVRRQRLEQARQALLEPEPNETVSEIATRFGFSNLAVFSRDFHGAFGLRPSELLREGRRHGR
jgi:AraC-like DNA-binding protein